MQNLKVVIVGDGAVGKSCFLIQWRTDSFHSAFINPGFDNLVNNIVVDGTPVSVSLQDTRTYLYMHDCCLHLYIIIQCIQPSRE